MRALEDILYWISYSYHLLSVYFVEIKMMRCQLEVERILLLSIVNNLLKIIWIEQFFMIAFLSVVFP